MKLLAQSPRYLHHRSHRNHHRSHLNDPHHHLKPNNRHNLLKLPRLLQHRFLALGTMPNVSWKNCGVAKWARWQP